MIPFGEMKKRLGTLGKNVAWLAEVTARSEGAIRNALSSGAKEKDRSTHVQRALSDAIEREEQRQRTFAALAPPTNWLSIDCPPARRQRWSGAALREGVTLDEWVVRTLERAAGGAAAGNGTDGQ
jgi:hypothetical protein